MEENKKKLSEYHRFLDEAGDTTFYGRGKVPIIGNEGVSKSFILGMLKIKEPLETVRSKMVALQNQIVKDTYYKDVPSVQKRILKSAFFVHAKDDIPEIRKQVFDLINTIDCSFECIVARKIYTVFENKHNGNESEFYADLLSHLLKNKLNKYHKLVLNISHRSKSTSHTNLKNGLNKASSKSSIKNPEKSNDCNVFFNVQYPTQEPLLNIADYMCWSVQRVFEKGEIRYYDFIKDKISLIVDLYDFKKYPNNGNYYNNKNPLTKENLLNEKSP